MMMRALVVMFALAVLAGGAFAQAELTPKAKAEAEAAAGQKLFDDGKFHDAAGHFVHANEIDPQAPYIYNAATAYRLAGDCLNAAKYYRTFVDATKGVQVQNIDKVKHYIDDMDACAKAAEPAPPPTPPPGPGVTQPGSEVRVPAPEPADPGRGKRRTGMVVAAVGVAAIGAGVAFGLAGKKTHDDEVTWSAMNCSTQPGMQCDGQYLKDHFTNPGKLDNILMGVSLGVGGAAVIGGVVLYVLGRGETGEQPVAVAPTRGGAMVTAGWSF
jgi:hypothetical protein